MQHETNIGIVEWVPEPPAAGGGRPRHDWSGVVDELRANPGKWALVSEDISRSVLTRMRKDYPDIEWTTRGAPEGTTSKNRGKLYARAGSLGKRRNRL